MRNVIVLMLASAACGGTDASDFGTKWTALNEVPGDRIIGGYAFDPSGRLLASNANQDFYRFDPHSRRWEIVAAPPTVTPSTQVSNDWAGTVISRDGTDAFVRLDDGDAWQTIVADWCNQDNRNYVAAPNGDVYFYAPNDSRGSKIWRVPAGASTPIEVTTFPTEDGTTIYRHTLSFAFDDALNAYATRSDNNGGTESLFVLPAGGSEMVRVIDTPGGVDISLVRRDGTVFLASAGIGRKTFYVLE